MIGGRSWTVQFKGNNPITYTIPRILSETTINNIKERMRHNKTHNRIDVKKYVLSGFIRCKKCGKALTGTTQQGKYKHYRHNGGRYEPCKALCTIPGEKIEEAVIKTIFENTFDEEGFNTAIKDSLPDKEYIDSLKNNIANNENALKKTNKALDKLVKAVEVGSLRKETIQKRESELYKAKTRLIKELEVDNQKLKSLPSIEELERKVKHIRMALMDYFGSEERMLKMSFDEKRRMPHQFLNGKNEAGNPYGVYIEKIDKGTWDYFISTEFFAGYQTLKGDDIDYWDDEIHNLYLKRLGLNKHYKTSVRSIHNRSNGAGVFKGTEESRRKRCFCNHPYARRAGLSLGKVTGVYYQFNPVTVSQKTENRDGRYLTAF